MSRHPHRLTQPAVDAPGSSHREASVERQEASAERGPSPSASDAKESLRLFYNSFTDYLSAVPEGHRSKFINFGYADDQSPGRGVTGASEALGHVNSARLVLETIGGCPLDGKDLLEVGCGRGGPIGVVLDRFPSVRRVVGLDLSSSAVEFCRSYLSRPNVHFEVGDAENLPFPDSSFDVVLNIESACHYPDVNAFYRSAFRVLRPAGHFLYSDSIDGDQVDHRLALLRGAGFTVESTRDVTANILRSSDEVAALRFSLMQAAGMPTIAGPRWDSSKSIEERMAHALCLPGTARYHRFARAEQVFVIWTLRKPE